MSSPTKLIIFTATWYPDTTDIRFQQCLETITLAHANKIPLVIIDASPPPVHAALQNTTAIVHPQTNNRGGGKGGALREAADLAAARPNVDDDTFLFWTEPEKTQMASLFRSVYDRCEDGDDIVVPYRNHERFRCCYPVEQYHSETFGNFYLDTVMNDALSSSSSSTPQNVSGPGTCRSACLSDPAFENEKLVTERSGQTIPVVDWHFGPFGFRKRHLSLWTEYSGRSYDAQLVPIVHGMRKGLRVRSILVAFELSGRMKEQEEGNVEFIEKRLKQLWDLDPVVKKAWSDEYYC